jgi:dolichol-phosphate mannosyltransferase
MPQLTLVIPTYNEAETLPELVAGLRHLHLGPLYILIVDDNSPDGTGALAEEMAAAQPDQFGVLHRAGKLGLGSAYLTGFRRALELGAQAIGQMDADLSHSPDYLPGFLQTLEHADAVFGSRYIPGGRLSERWSLGRVLLSRFGNLYARTILGLKVRDATGGFRLWRAETLRGMPLDRIHSEGYVFQVEMAYVAQRLGYQVEEMPIYFEDRRLGRSKMSARIQVEAALRVWLLLLSHRGLKPQPPRQAD